MTKYLEHTYGESSHFHGIHITVANKQAVCITFNYFLVLVRPLPTEANDKLS